MLRIIRTNNLNSSSLNIDKIEKQKIKNKVNLL